MSVEVSELESKKGKNDTKYVKLSCCWYGHRQTAMTIEKENVPNGRAAWTERLILFVLRISQLYLQLWWASPGQQVSKHPFGYSLMPLFLYQHDEAENRKKKARKYLSLKFNKWREKKKNGTKWCKCSNSSLLTSRLMLRYSLSNHKLEDTPLPVSSSTTTFTAVFDAV